MALPILNVPKYELTVPSTGNKIQYRPFLVKEEKILLMAAEGEDKKSIVTAIVQIITNCVIGTVDIEKLTTYDLEYIFLKLRARSVGESSELRYICQKTIKGKKGEKGDKTCGSDITTSVDLSSIEVNRPDNHTTHVSLIDNIGIVFKDPPMSLLEFVILPGAEIDNVDMVVACIDYIYEGEKIYKSDDYKKEELVSFIETLTQKQFEEVKTFFRTVPNLEHTLKLECPSCKNKSEIVLRGLNDFFM